MIALLAAIIVIVIAFGISGLIFWGIGSFIIWAFGINFVFTFWHGVAVAFIISILTGIFGGKK